jgi:hypothetical protein
MIPQLIVLLLLAVVVFALVRWYQHEQVFEADATVHLMSEHEHFHLHVDLPPHLKVEPGDTLHILSIPKLDAGRTNGGEVTYESRVRLHKASWLQRHLIRNSSLVEINELVEHP